MAATSDDTEDTPSDSTARYILGELERLFTHRRRKTRSVPATVEEGVASCFGVLICEAHFSRQNPNRFVIRGHRMDDGESFALKGDVDDFHVVDHHEGLLLGLHSQRLLIPASIAIPAVA